MKHKEKYDKDVVNIKPKDAKKHMIFLLSILCILVFSWFGSVYWVTDEVAFYENYIPTSVIVIFCLISGILIVVAYIFLFKDSIKSKAFNRMMLKWNRLPIRKRKLIHLMLISSITIGIVFLKLYYNDKIFAYSDIGSDTIVQYLPQYNLIVNKIRNGTFSMWLSEVGYGYNLAYFFMFSPLLLFVFLGGVLLGTQCLPILVVVYKIVGMLLCAYVAFKFLELFSEHYDVIAIGAYLYAFSGFAIVWGQHYVFFDYPLYAIVVFYCIERYLRSQYRRFNLPLILISFACMLFSIYMSYMIYLPACIYAIIRYIQLGEKFKWKDFISSMLHLALNIGIGFVGGLCTGLLYAKNIFGSGRVTSETSAIVRFVEYIKESYLKDDFLGSLQRFLSANLNGIGSEHVSLENYYGESQLFFSALFWVILFQFIFTIHKISKNRKQMICGWSAVILVGLAIYNKGFLFVMYAFSQISTRTTFALFPILAIMAVVVLDNIFYKRILSKMGLLLGSVITIVLLFYNWSSFWDIEKKILIVVSLITLVVALIIIGLTCFTEKYVGKYELIIVLSIVIFMNVTTEMYMSMNRVGLAGEQWAYEDEVRTNTKKAIDYLEKKDNTYYRTEKMYSSWNGVTDSFYEGYYPISTYNSSMSYYTQEYNELFMNPMFLSIVWYRPSFISSPNDIIQYSSLGLKYVLSDYPLSDYKHYELIKQIDDIYIYKNLAVESFTTFFDDVVLKSEFEELNYNDKNKIQQKALVIDDEDSEEFSEKIKSVQQVLDEYEEEDLTKYVKVDGKEINNLLKQEIDSDVELTFSNDWYNSVTGTAFLELDINPMTEGTIKIYYDTGKGFNEQERDLVYCTTEECQMRYVLPENIEKIRITFSSVPSELIELKIMNSLEEIKSSENQSVLYEGENSSQIKGNISCDRDGVLYIPLPYDNNWKIKIDGKEVKTYAANVGFLAVNISKGEHNIEIVYDSIEMKLGVLCLVIAILMACIYYFLSQDRKKFVKAI